MDNQMDNLWKINNIHNYKAYFLDQLLEHNPLKYYYHHGNNIYHYHVMDFLLFVWTGGKSKEDLLSDFNKKLNNIKEKSDANTKGID